MSHEREMKNSLLKSLIIENCTPLASKQVQLYHN